MFRVVLVEFKQKYENKNDIILAKILLENQYKTLKTNAIQ